MPLKFQKLKKTIFEYERKEEILVQRIFLRLKKICFFCLTICIQSAKKKI